VAPSASLTRSASKFTRANHQNGKPKKRDPPIVIEHGAT
jgi:hypothetical protein